jgi:hypothetical protein
MKALLTTATAIALAVSPASAQLLGGGGLGGSLGGTLGGTLGGAGSIGDTGSRLGGVTDGTLRGRGETSGSQRVDRKSGTVSADRSVSGSLDGAVSQTLDTPRRSVSAGGSGNASGSAGAGGSAQLVGTDAPRDTIDSSRSTLRETAGSARSTVRSTADYAGTTARGTVDGARSTAVNGVATARGATEASAANVVTATSNQLAIAGSAAANATGAVAVEPGMLVQSAKGRTIGTVHDVVTDSRGRVQALVVEADDRRARIPVANFSGNGEVLFTGMSKGEIKQASKQQADEQPAS